MLRSERALMREVCHGYFAALSQSPPRCARHGASRACRYAALPRLRRLATAGAIFAARVDCRRQRALCAYCFSLRHDGCLPHDVDEEAARFALR